MPKRFAWVRRLLSDGFAALIVAGVLALFTRVFLVQAYRIPSDSMAPTLVVGDHLLINKFIFGAGAERWSFLLPQRQVRPGDLVTFRSQQAPHELLKRCVANGGDTVEIDGKRLRVDGDTVDESGYVVFTDDDVYPRSEFLHEDVWRRDSFGPLDLEEGTLFCLGDNRDVSRDSRFFGPVDTNLVRGRPLLIYWSRDREAGRWGVRWRRSLHMPR